MGSKNDKEVGSGTAWREALAQVAERLTGLDWALAGSAASILQGLAVEPRDLDLLTDAETAYRIAARLDDGVTLPMAWRENEHYASHFGRFVLGGTKIEVMGDLELRGRGCTLHLHSTSLIWKRLRPTTFLGHRLRLIPLEAQLVANLVLGKEERARWMATHLGERGYDGDLLREILTEGDLSSAIVEEVRGLLGGDTSKARRMS
ncbi:MAG: nucleotidyltransferase domain-containing protein [Anaerolineae bacterium]